MNDLALNSDFSVFLNDRNDLATVSGKDAFEQSVAIMLTDFMYQNIPGVTDRETIEQRLRLEVNRVAREHDFIDEVSAIFISEKAGAVDTYAVEITYISDDFSTFSEEAELQ